MDGKDGIMMCKLNGRMDKEGQYDVEMKGWIQNIMCDIKGQMDKGGHYVQMKRWMQKRAL